jgi:LacI family transcriptional regulator
MTTIKDVADQAGVSIATVSRVLNQNRYVSPELNERVRQAIADLHYEQNALARNLRRSESLTLGIIIPDSTNPFFAEVARGIEDVCFEQGYLVILCNTSEDPEKAAAYLSSLRQNRVAGVIIVSPGELHTELRQSLRAKYPLVVADRLLPGLPIDSVISDNGVGAEQAVHHLLALGHRRIGVVVGNHLDTRQTIKARLNGVLRTLAEAGLAIDEDLIYTETDYTPEGGYAAACSLLERPNPPTAIFAFNDLLAFGVVSYAYQQGIRIPEHLSVVGFDDINLAAYIAPALTTIAQPKYELGRKAADILLDRIHGELCPPRTLVLPTRLVVRQSTAQVCYAPALNGH